MDKNDILREAKATIASIKSAQTTLNNYKRRLEGIVERLEFEELKHDKLTLHDVENINETIKEAHTNLSEEKAIFKPEQFNQEEVNLNTDKFRNIRVYTLLVLGIILLFFSLIFTVKRISPNYNFFNHYVYNYTDTNMANEIKPNSLVIVSKLRRQEIAVDDDIAYKSNVDSIKIARVSEVVDNRQHSYQAKSLNSDSEELLLRAEILGKVKTVIPVLGGIFTILVKRFWIMYLLSGVTLFLAYYINRKNPN